MTPPDCPPAADLQRMLADDLPPDRAAAVEGHVATCPACQAELERLTDTPTALGRDLPPTRTGRAGPTTPAALAGPAAGGARLRDPAASWAAAGWASSTGPGRCSSNRAWRLKMILAGEFAAPEVAERFLAEAEAVARMRAPEHRPDLRRRRARRAGRTSPWSTSAAAPWPTGSTGAPWPPREAAALVEAVARGLHQAHRPGSSTAT